jgi:hypothetical protein
MVISLTSISGCCGAPVFTWVLSICNSGASRASLRGRKRFQSLDTRARTADKCAMTARQLEDRGAFCTSPKEVCIMLHIVTEKPLALQ